MNHEVLGLTLGAVEGRLEEVCFEMLSERI